LIKSSKLAYLLSKSGASPKEPSMQRRAATSANSSLTQSKLNRHKWANRRTWTVGSTCVFRCKT